MTASVTLLPTAAPRKVQQRSIRAVRQAKAAAPWPGNYKRPYQRAAASIVAKAGGSPEALILHVILKAMSTAERRGIQVELNRLHLAVGDDVSLAAARIVSDAGRGE